MIGQRLRVARAGSGLSLRALEGRIDKLVTAQAIGKYERNEAMPGSKVLIALAEGLNTSVEYLLGHNATALVGVEFRKNSLTRKRDRAQVEARTLELVDRYLAIEELLDLPSAVWDQPDEAPYRVRELADAERAAGMVRSCWRLGIDPIANMVETLEERGVKALSMDLPSSISGLTAHATRSDGASLPVIVVNGASRGERQRFTLAHELGHLVMDVVEDVGEEKAANRFAGSFLMPAESLRPEIGKRRQSFGWGELFELKGLYRVSVQALTYRGHDLGIFNDRLFRDLFREFGRRGWRKPPYEEPYGFPGEESRRFERLCYRALAEDVISEAKAAELLGISVRDLDNRMSMPLQDCEEAFQE